MPHRFFTWSGPILAMAVVGWAIFEPDAGPARPAGLLVPAYFYPTAGNDWARMQAVARRVPLTAILNPASGPGTRVDPNYVKATNGLRAAGGSVVAYVHTSYGDRGLAAVEADIARYAGFYRVDGFFIDEMSNELSNLPYYRKLYDHIKKIDAKYQVIGNPGTAIPEAYLTSPTADTLVTFEGTGASYASATPAPHAGRYPPGRFAHIVHGVATPAAMLEGLSLASGRNVGLVYVTDNPNLSNPYGRLPAYFDREVAALRAAPPRLGSLTPVMLAIGLFALVVARRLATRPILAR